MKKSKLILTLSLSALLAASLIFTGCPNPPTQPAPAETPDTPDNPDNPDTPDNPDNPDDPNKPNGGDEEQHTHTFEEAWTFDENDHWHKATCEHTNEVSDKAGHTWDYDNSTVVKEPTTTTTGEKSIPCTVCDKTKTETISVIVPEKVDAVSYVEGQTEYNLGNLADNVAITIPAPKEGEETSFVDPTELVDLYSNINKSISAENKTVFISFDNADKTKIIGRISSSKLSSLYDVLFKKGNGVNNDVISNLPELEIELAGSSKQKNLYGTNIDKVAQIYQANGGKIELYNSASFDFDAKEQLGNKGIYDKNTNTPNANLYSIDVNVSNLLACNYKNVKITGQLNTNGSRGTYSNVYFDADMSNAKNLGEVTGLAVFANKPPQSIPGAQKAKLVFTYNDENWFDDPIFNANAAHTLDFSKVSKDIVENSVFLYSEGGLNPRHIITPIGEDENKSFEYAIGGGMEVYNDAASYPISDETWEEVGNGTKDVDDYGVISYNNSKTSAVKQSLLEKMLENNQKTYS